MLFVGTEITATPQAMSMSTSTPCSSGISWQPKWPLLLLWRYGYLTVRVLFTEHLSASPTVKLNVLSLSVFLSMLCLW